MLVTETMVDHLAKSLGMDPFRLRTRNLYEVKNATDKRDAGIPYGMVLPPLHAHKYTCVVHNAQNEISCIRFSFFLRTRTEPPQPEESTHFGQPLEAWNVPDAWSDMQRWADIGRRRKKVSSVRVLPQSS